MPQMAPTNWMFLIITAMLVIYFIPPMIHFLNQKPLYLDSHISSSTNYQWKW